MRLARRVEELEKAVKMLMDAINSHSKALYTIEKRLDEVEK